MGQLTIALFHEDGEQQAALVDELIESPAVGEVLLLRHSVEDYATARLRTRWVQADSMSSGAGVNKILQEAKHEYLLFILPGQPVRLGARACERLLQVAEDSGSGLVYSDFKEESAGAIS